MTPQDPARSLERWLPTLVRIYRDRRRQTARAADARAALLGQAELRELGAALLRLQRGLTGDRRLAGSSYMDDDAMLGAYLLYYWPVSYMQCRMALAESEARPRSILDIGAGPGPATAAALDHAAADPRPDAEPAWVDHGDARAVLLDGSDAALDMARAFFSSRGRGTREKKAPSFVYGAVDLEDNPDIAGLEILRGENHFDLVILGHCLNELWRVDPDRLRKRLGLIESVASLLKPDGTLLVIEPALLLTSREALSLRDELAAKGYPIRGPCPRGDGPYPCPALAAGPARSCHSEADWDPPSLVRSLASEAGLDRESIKAAWFAIGRPQSPARSASEPRGQMRAGTRPISTLRGRVISEAMLNKSGRLRFLVCAGERLASLSAKAGAPETSACGFLSLKRGDFIEASGLEPRGQDGFGILPGSTIRSRTPGPDFSAKSLIAAEEPSHG